MLRRVHIDSSKDCDATHVAQLILMKKEERFQFCPKFNKNKLFLLSLASKTLNGDKT